MSLEEIDGALARMREERERISLNLVELENHQGHRFLQGARLSGVTERRWAEASEHITRLWRLFDGYRRVTETAERLRAERQRPAPAALAELTRLLTGPSVEFAQEPTPLEKRTLLGTATERLTLEAVVDQMTIAYGRAVEMVAAADAAWSALLPRLADLERTWQETGELLAALEIGHATYERLGRDFERVRDTVRGDPLSLARGEGVDTTELDRLRTGMEGLRTELQEAGRLRTSYEERARLVSASIEEVAAVTEEARRSHATALEKIAEPGLGEVPDPAPGLRQRLTSLEALRDRGRWVDLAAAMSELETDVAGALARVRAELEASAGLMARRAELRGRLDAYRIKAARLGHAEHPDLTRLQQQARELLWTAPCDLRASTAVLARYQRALHQLENGG